MLYDVIKHYMTNIILTKEFRPQIWTGDVATDRMPPNTP